MFSLVSLFSGIYQLPAMHSLLVCCIFVMLQFNCMLSYNSYSQSKVTSQLQERIYQMDCLTFNTAQWFMTTTFTSSKGRKMTKTCHQRIITWKLLLRLGRHMKTIVSKNNGLYMNYVTVV